MTADITFQHNPPQLRFLSNFTDSHRIHHYIQRHCHSIEVADLIELPTLHRLQNTVQIAINDPLMCIFLPQQRLRKRHVIQQTVNRMNAAGQKIQCQSPTDPP